jgi:YHS domain-containing protein
MLILAIAALTTALMVGCQSGEDETASATSAATTAAPSAPADTTPDTPAETPSEEEATADTPSDEETSEVATEIGNETDADGQYVCPVMGTAITVSDDTLHTEYKGKTYYFCCPGCPEKFEENPEEYIASGQHASEDTAS